MFDKLCTEIAFDIAVTFKKETCIHTTGFDWILNFFPKGVRVFVVVGKVVQTCDAEISVLTERDDASQCPLWEYFLPSIERF